MNEIRSWVFLALGLLLSGLTGLALYGVSQDASSRGQAAAAADSLEVIVAAADIPARSVITSESVRARSFPRELVPTGAFGQAQEAIGQTTVVAIPRGAVVVRDQLIAAGGSRGASVTLDKGFVLVAFPTSDPLTTAGLVEAGDRVDILATVTASDGTRRTQTIVQNLTVRDVVRSTQGTRTSASLTFAVDAQTALILKNLRDSQYTIDVVVRARVDNEPARTTTVDVDYISQRYGIKK